MGLFIPLLKKKQAFGFQQDIPAKYCLRKRGKKTNSTLSCEGTGGEGRYHARVRWDASSAGSPSNTTA